MNILIISCSPKKEKSNTYKIAQTFLKEISKVSNIQSLFLYDKNINFCTACLRCMRTGNPCYIEDDVLEIVEKTKEYDYVIWCIPHMGPTGFPSKLKAFFERCCNSGALFFNQRNDIGENNILLCGCGHPIKKNIEDLEFLISSFKENFGILDSFIIPEADLLTFYSEDIETKKLLKKIKLAGSQFFRKKDTKLIRKILQSPQIPEEIYKEKYLKPLYEI